MATTTVGGLFYTCSFAEDKLRMCKRISLEILLSHLIFLTSFLEYGLKGKAHEVNYGFCLLHT